jgi:L-lactate utilization protein LutB
MWSPFAVNIQLKQEPKNRTMSFNKRRETTMNSQTEVFSQRNQTLAETVIKGLKSRGFEPYFCADKTEALKKALSLIPPKSSVSWGGSVTLEQIGIFDELKKIKDLTIIDRDTAKTPEERFEMMRKSLSSDVFLMSANAITTNGELVNIDGMGNRLAALLFGPKSVIVIAGVNKISHRTADALHRARGYAAPLNVARLKITDTPCALTGICADCKTPSCVCAQIVTTRLSKIPNRIKIILVGENLGY